MPAADRRHPALSSTGRRGAGPRVTELTQTEVREYMRPSLFANTPDILHAYLQQGGRPAFEVRLLLAATLGAAYGIYSGFELCENHAVPGTEEYFDSEKYQVRKWDWGRPGNIKPLVGRVNDIRRDNPALWTDASLRFHACDNPHIICYSKRTRDLTNIVYVVMNLDPFNMREGHVQVPLADWHLDPEGYHVDDLLSGERCVQCNTPLQPVENWFSAGSGGVCCPRCGEGARDDPPDPAGAEGAALPAGTSG